MADDGGAGAAGGDALGLSPTDAPAARATTQPQHQLADEAERVAFALSDKLSAAPGRETPEPTTTTTAAAAPVTQTPAVEAEHVAGVVDAGAGGESREVEARGAGGGAGGADASAGEPARGAGVLGRAAGAGARAGESLRPGVDRLRGAVVAFDEASSDDPGLRFVVAAGLLFLVFLLLWIISYVLG